ncbi:MAG: SLC13 family permease [Thermoanaerobaculia bacterium]
MHLPALPLLLFAATYLLLAMGRVPGLALDRTGFAVLGALAFLATGGISLEQAKSAVDAPTIALLFSMMLLSAQYQLSGLYGAIGRRLAAVQDPRRLLAGVLVVSALLAGVLTNDVVCFALTPLVCSALLATRLDPLPYLLAIACGTNLGSALTPIGNPQNILISQKLGLSFLPFVLVCALPVLVSLAFTYWLLARRLRTRPLEAPDADDVSGIGPEIAPTPAAPALDRRESGKAILLTAVAIALFLSPVPAYLTGCGIAGVVLTSRRMRSRTMLGLVDWQMLALFVALFVVTRGLELSGWTEAGQRWIERAGMPLSDVAVLVPLVAVLGNLVGNVPAVMVLLRFVTATAGAANVAMDSPVIGYALALASTFAGNALIIASVANLIVVEQADRLGIRIGFRDHLRVGVPVTLFSLGCAVLTLLWISR